ncbi:hypothetical protein RvY_03429-2 [Ramazzottius varieornatus]|uniref:Uncharacterized protein n=1 Tax=Ramazzottius varieornatus TaxID=947166 RepID=A0A1D1UNU2_RAMVA|nr:hypothetical protein RvY_03429-2 [Ramazzottius varieornatus]
MVADRTWASAVRMPKTPPGTWANAAHTGDLVRSCPGWDGRLVQLTKAKMQARWSDQEEPPAYCVLAVLSAPHLPRFPSCPHMLTSTATALIDTCETKCGEFEIPRPA